VTKRSPTCSRIAKATSEVVAQLEQAERAAAIEAIFSEAFRGLIPLSGRLRSCPTGRPGLATSRAVSQGPLIG
jgi:hypothetical protein